MAFSFKAVSYPACREFFKIKRYKEDSYIAIDEFKTDNPNISEEELNECFVEYRGKEKTFLDFTNDYISFSERLLFLDLKTPNIITDSSVNASFFFAKKIAECLQTARFFSMKSFELIETNDNINWNSGYVAHFYFRCIYFGTACTWYQNAFDHILQTIYWGLKLYTSVCDRNGKHYDNSWNEKQILEACTYEFVVAELKQRGFTDIRKQITQCSAKTEDVRKWANYIKHKGGIEYKYLEAEEPYKILLTKINTNDNTAESSIAEKTFEIKNFKSPVEVDIDEDITKLENAHIELCNCAKNVIGFIDYEKYSLSFGGK